VKPQQLGPIGRMYDSIVIERPVVTVDGAGQSVTTWECVARVFSSVEAVSAAEQYQGEQPRQHGQYVVKIWYRQDVDESKGTWRISFAGRRLDILGVRDPDGRKRFLELTCVETGR
jgi:SPP1 family predicted phage head-tail adaptor